jgi:hypothetical protein
MKYQILDMTPVGMDPFTNRPRYKFSHGLPWIKHLETEHRDPNEAFAEAHDGRAIGKRKIASATWRMPSAFRCEQTAPAIICIAASSAITARTAG